MIELQRVNKPYRVTKHQAAFENAPEIYLGMVLTESKERRNAATLDLSVSSALQSDVQLAVQTELLNDFNLDRSAEEMIPLLYKEYRI